MASFTHPAIGQIVCKEVEGCTQFLGVKYATIADRFAPPELVQYDGGGIYAAKYGPQVISPPEGVDIEFGFIQRSLPKPDFPGVSDLDGLSLNITVPGQANTISSTNNLPVLVFIHGGGFSIGANWWPQYDFVRLVKLSADLGSPIIGISINYRLGAPGFLTSPELRAAGKKPNNGLRDQQMALQWIKKYIGGFGGSPDNVTVMGESAGGVSTGYLLFSEQPLAKRLICLGGCPPLLGQLSMEAADQIANHATTCLGVEGEHPSELVQGLLEAPMDKFWTAFPPTLPLLPVIDGDIIPREVTFELFSQGQEAMPSLKWIEGLMIGDSQLDGSIMAYLGLLSRKVGIATAFRSSATKSLLDYPDSLASLLDHYSLSESATRTLTDDEALFKILAFISDVAFFMPAIELASNFPGDSFVFAFNERNPWEGLFKGHASHILDVAFLFQNFNESLDEAQRASAEAFGRDVISFVNGQAPWKAFNAGAHGVGVYTNGGREYVEPPAQEKTGRSPFVFQLAKGENGPGMGRLMQVFTDFIAG
ncbi:hypothetical protein AK830_g6442 [Neonectria ditissima]|uniref:Carboxylic ester hydrolase n=1 Tax=Neonectria ditissima TaxID=78410 RepID=A0A0N8H6W9_9HYPO|nr:hypothetical protein AK830_g6442 [Neonectria ditissima]